MERYVCTERENIKEMLDRSNENTRLLTRHGEQLAGLRKRVEATDDLVRVIHELATNVAVLSQNMREVRETVKCVEEDVKDLKRRPQEEQQAKLQDIKKFRREVILLLIGAGITLVVGIVGVLLSMGGG